LQLSSVFVIKKGHSKLDEINANLIYSDLPPATNFVRYLHGNI